jgi:hypothetical protein
MVRDLDRERLGLMRDLLGERFTGDELEMKARTFVTLYGMETATLVRRSRAKRLEDARRRIDMLLIPLNEPRPEARRRP